MPGICRRAVCAALALSLLMTAMGSAGHAAPAFQPRRTFGILFVGGSLLMAKKSYDYHKDADAVYEAYKVAGNAAEASMLFARSSDRDTKSQLSIGISLVLLAGGIRLLLSSGKDDNVPKYRPAVSLEMTQDPQSGALGVALRRDF